MPARAPVQIAQAGQQVGDHDDLFEDAVLSAARMSTGTDHQCVPSASGTICALMPSSLAAQTSAEAGQADQGGEAGAVGQVGTGGA